MKIIYKLFPVMFCLGLAACSTIFSGTTDTIQIMSEPTNARVYYNGRYMGTSPVTLTASRSVFANETPQIRVEKDGYKKQEFPLVKSFNAVAISNTISLYLWTTDFFSGAVVRYSPTEYMILLEKENQTISDIKYLRMSRYIHVNYDNIRREMAVGSGEYLDALEELFKSINPTEPTPFKHEKENKFMNAKSRSDYVSMLLIDANKP